MGESAKGVVDQHPRPLTARRYKALQWFYDHDQLGPDAVLTQKPPTARMRNLMAREHQVMRLPVGHRLDKWLLTTHGIEALLRKGERRRDARRSKAPRDDQAAAG